MSKKGLNSKGRIIPTDLCNLSAVAMAEFGMTVKTIAKATGLTESQVTYRYRQAGVSPMNYRRGEGPFASEVLQKYSVKSASKQVHDELIEDYAEFLGFEHPFEKYKSKSRKKGSKKYGRKSA